LYFATSCHASTKSPLITASRTAGLPTGGRINVPADFPDDRADQIGGCHLLPF
jgi:hypothetical protein